MNKIRQIIPAQPEWNAVFADDSRRGAVFFDPIAAWALVYDEVEDMEFVVPLTSDGCGGIDSASDSGNHIGIAAPGEGTEERWFSESAHFYDRRQKRRESRPTGVAPPPEPGRDEPN